jgi:hypothetical protein
MNKPVELYNCTTKNTPIQKIVVAHSFGGTKILCDIFGKSYYQPPYVSAVILINSHFNQRSKMPYFPLHQNYFPVPILTILTTRDDRLPIHTTVDDYLASYQEEIVDKFYYINRGDHFSTFENPADMHFAIHQIQRFIEETREENATFHLSNYVMDYFTKKHMWFFQEREFNNTVLRPNFFRFLVSRPAPNNSFYRSHKYNLLKTNDFNIKAELDHYYGLDVEYNFTDYRDIYYRDWTNSSYTAQKIMESFMAGFTLMNMLLFVDFIMKEFVNEFIYKMQIPWFLFQWFTYEPKINKTQDSFGRDRVSCEILSIPIRDNIVYYKMPSKHKIFEFLGQEDLL